MNQSVLQDEGAHPFALRCDLVFVPEVVDRPVLLLFLRERRAEVVSELAAERRHPRKHPLHPSRVRLQLRQRGNRLGDQRHVMTVEVRENAVEMVGDERATGATGVLLIDPVPEPEHEVIDEQLRAAVEEVRERLRPFARLEDVLPLDRDPRKVPATARELVATARMRLLGSKQLRTRRQPFLSRPNHMLDHQEGSFPSWPSGARTASATARPVQPVTPATQTRRAPWQRIQTSAIMAP